MAGPGAKALTIVFIGGLSWYAGLKFWQPLIVDQLKKDGNLRDDVYIRDTSDQPKSWTDLQERVRYALHPDLAAKELNKDVPTNTSLTKPEESGKSS